MSEVIEVAYASPRSPTRPEGSNSLPPVRAHAKNSNRRDLRRCICGPKGIRTPDLLAASQALYQLSYGPARRSLPGGRRLRTIVPGHALGILPQPFQVVILAFFIAENVDHYVHIVQQPPT